MKNALILLFAFAVLGGACAGYSKQASETSANKSNSSSYPSAPAGKNDIALKTVEPQSSGRGGGGKNEIVKQQTSLSQLENSQPAPVERKIIRNADLQLETGAPDEAQQKITAIAESKGGFVVESQQSSSDVRTTTRDTVTMTLRVPADKFSEALEEIRRTASRVVVETVKSDDVTEEFIDIEAQLKAKKALEAQFLEIMKRAATVEDALNVQRQLAEVRGEIEKIEGRKRFLENQAALSTIKIRLQTPAAFSANSTGFGYRLREAFGDGFDAALNFILGLVTFLIAVLPFLIFIVLPIFLLIRLLLKRRRKRKTADEIVKEELKNE